MRTTGWSPRRISARTLLLLLAWTTWSSQALGQSVDTSMARATIDQPLSMTVQVRGFDWPASRLTPECLQVQLRQGESGDTITPLRLRTVPSGDDGRVLVQISSPQKVLDTVLTGRLGLLCGADFTREFTVLADPPTTPQRPAPATARRGIVAPLPPATPSPPSAAKFPDPRHVLAPAESERPAAAVPRHLLDDTDVQQLVTAIVTALAQAQPPAPATPPWLDLRDEQRQTHASLAALQARLDRAEHDRWRDAALVIGVAVALALSRMLWQVVQESLMPRLVIGHSTAPVRRRPRAPRRPHRDDIQPTTPTPPPRTTPTAPAPETSAATLDLHQGLMQWSAPTDHPGDTSAHLDSDPQPPTTGPDAPPRHWPDADFGHPSLDTTLASTDLLQELEPHTADFPIGVAVVLERRLQALPGKCPWILLRLLALYRQMAQPWNHDRVAAQLEALYNVRIPDMEADATPALTDLQAFPDTLDRVGHAWQQDDPVPELTTLLLRPVAVETLALPAFEEVLMLHGIALQRQTPWLTAVPSLSASAPHPAPLPRDRLLDLLAA